jgi:predicted dehydrogenase
MRRIRIGVIGCGVIGSKHVELASACPDIDVAAVADVRRDVAQAVAKKHGVKHVYGSAEELLADKDVQGVVLAMPTCLRLELGLKAFAAGKHLLTEKPVAMSAAQVYRLIEARGSLIAGCCSCRLRSQPSTRPAIEALQAGKLGDLRVLHCRAIWGLGAKENTPPVPWRLSRSLNGGGVLVNWGCYDLDYLLGICDWRVKPRTALAQTWPIAPHLSDRVAEGSDAETHVAAVIRCDDGVLIHYERAEYAAVAMSMNWQIVGTKGSLRLPMMPGVKKQLVLDIADPQRGIDSQVLWEGDEGWDVQHAGPVIDFAAAIREHRQPMTSLENALVLQKITDAVYASAATGQAVAVS